MERRWRANVYGYVYCYEGGRKLLQHRVVWEEHHGPIPAGSQIHHVNHDRGDNRIENLRCLTPKEHRQEHAKATKVVVCGWCGADFECSVAGTTARYCPGCRWKVGESKRRLNTRTCDHCGATFQTRSARFCSQRCVNLGARWARLQPDGDTNA